MCLFRLICIACLATFAGTVAYDPVYAGISYLGLWSTQSEINVKGKIVDQAGHSLEGIAVIERGTQNGMTTDQSHEGKTSTYGIRRKKSSKKTQYTKLDYYF